MTDNINCLHINFVNNTINDVYKCINCDSIFKNKQTLNIHIITSKKCSNKDNNNDIVEDTKTCLYCSKTFASKQMKNYHQSKCTSKTIFELTKKYEDEIDCLKKYYENEILKLKTNKNL
jgi:hypothetical protein